MLLSCNLLFHFFRHQIFLFQLLEAKDRGKYLSPKEEEYLGGKTQFYKKNLDAKN